MAFSLELTPAVKTYLAHLPGLSRTERIRLFTGLHENLAIVPDAFRADPDNRPAPDSAHFVWIFALPKDAGGAHTFRLFVDDSGAAYGVLRIVYVDHS